MGTSIELLLDEATREIRADAEAEVASFLEVKTADDYRRYLGRAYGFVAPLERTLVDTPGLELVIDTRRFAKHQLLESDLQATGLKLIEIQSLPQCMWIPWFEDVHTALGWAYLVERSMLSHPSLFRHLASALPGEAAFGASFLKSYTSASGQLWKSFLLGVTRSITEPAHRDLTIAGAKAAYRFFRRWRATLDGKALSTPPEGEPAEATPVDEPEVAVPVDLLVARERAPSSPED